MFSTFTYIFNLVIFSIKSKTKWEICRWTSVMIVIDLWSKHYAQYSIQNNKCVLLMEVSSRDYFFLMCSCKSHKFIATFDYSSHSFLYSLKNDFRNDPLNRFIINKSITVATPIFPVEINSKSSSTYAMKIVSLVFISKLSYFWTKKL